MISLVTVVFVLLPLLGQALEKGERCTNQWGEKATCTNIYNCKAAMDALAIANGSRLYAAGILCGFDNEALVCCRTLADFDENSVNDIVPLDPTTVSSVDDLNISTNTSSFNNSTQLVLELANNSGSTEDPTLIFSSPSETSTNNFIDVRSSSNKVETTASSITFSGEAIYTSPPIVQTTDKTSTPPPVVIEFTTEATTLRPLTPTTVVPDPLPLQSNDTSESPVGSDFSRIPEEFTSRLPDTAFDIFSKTTPPLSFFTEPSVTKHTTQGHIDHLLPDRNMCGVQYKRDRLPDAPIASIDEFPWVALIRYQDSFGQDVGFKCVGTLITNRFVMTSASCLATGPEYFEPKSVRLGEWSLSSVSDCVFDYKGEVCPDKVVDVGIEKKIPHPNRNNNIALIRMKRKVHFTDFVRPICLPIEHLRTPSEGTILTSSGWGASKSGCLLDVKSKIHLPVLSKQRCSNNAFFFTRILEDQVCVNAFSRSGMCKTDSGGPLMLLDDDDDEPQWYLEGIIPESFYCDNRGFRGIYTRITKYIPWIVFTLGQEGD